MIISSTEDPKESSISGNLTTRRNQARSIFDARRETLTTFASLHSNTSFKWQLTNHNPRATDAHCLPTEYSPGAKLLSSITTLSSQRQSPGLLFQPCNSCDQEQSCMTGACKASWSEARELQSSKQPPRNIPSLAPILLSSSTE